MPVVSLAAGSSRTRFAAVAAVFGSLLLSFTLAAPALGASVAANQAALQAQLLTLANLPPGWTITNAGTGGGDSTGSCAGRPFGTLDRIADTEASFEDPSGLPQLYEQISVYSGTSSVFEHGVRAIDRCHTESLDEGGVKLKIRVAKLAYPGGKRSAAYSLKFTLKGQKVGIDMVVEEIGNEIAKVSVASVPSPVLGQVKQLVALAVDKIGQSAPAPG